MIYIKDGVRVPAKKLQRMQIVEPLKSGYYELKIPKKPVATKLQKVVDAGSIEVVGIWQVDWQIVDKTDAELVQVLENMRKDKLKSLSDYFKSISERPIIDTGYGFSVQAGYNDLASFQVGVDLGLLEIRAADNAMYSVTKEQFEDVLLQIKQNGARLMSIKWATEDEIKHASIEELEAINFEERFND